jgi:hypothetical protein
MRPRQTDSSGYGRLAIVDANEPPVARIPSWLSTDAPWPDASGRKG